VKKCAVCCHAQRPAIDLAIASGLSKRAIGEKYGLHPDSVWRHGRSHLSPEMKAALALRLLKKEGDTRQVLLEEGANVAQAIAAVRAPLFSRFLVACDTGDDRAVAALAGRLHEGLALTAKLTGELVPHAGVSITNVVLHPDYQRLRSELLRILGRFPDAREAVAAAFRGFGEVAAGEMARSMPRMIEGTATEVVDAAA
jgi:hypothetical protein